MKRNFAGILVVAAMLLHTGRALAAEEQRTSAAADSEVVNMVVATVDGEPLTMADLRRYMAAKGEQSPEGSPADANPLQKHLRELVLDTLIGKEAKEAGISIGDDEVQAYITEIAKQNGVDEATFVSLLEQRGISLEEYKNQARADILRLRLVAARIRSKINVLDEDISRYLQEHPELVPAQGTVRLEQIAVRFRPGERAGAVEQISRIREEALRGGPLAAAGGRNYRDLGFVKISDLREELQEAAEPLKPGQLSGIIETPGQLVVLKMGNRGGDEGQIDERLKEQIRAAIYQTRFSERVDKYLNDELPKKYNVEFKL